MKNMMKKEYFAPEMEIVDIKFTGILCNSGDGNVFDEDTEDVGNSGEPGAIAE